MKTSVSKVLLSLFALWATVWAGTAHAAYSCSLSPTSVGVIYVRGNAVRTDAVGSVTITCTRDPATDANTLTYKIGADNGANANGNTRRVRMGTGNQYLTYTVTKGTVAGGGATCADADDWLLPIFGTAGAMVGTMAFGASGTASQTWSYCARVRGNQGNAQGGLYVDSLNVYAQYPNTLAGAIAGPVALTYSVGARNECVINTFPTDMAFNYSAFQPSAQVLTQVFALDCSANLYWSVAVSPAASALLGLNYSLAAAPASGTGTSAPQNVTITATMPANQRGICPTAVCTASQPHTVTISY